MANQSKRCEMVHVPHPDHEYECKEPAIAEVEGGAACLSCSNDSKKEGLEVLPLGTDKLYSTGKAAFDHAKQFTNVYTTADCLIKAVAAMIAFNEENRG